MLQREGCVEAQDDFHMIDKNREGTVPYEIQHVADTVFNVNRLCLKTFPKHPNWKKMFHNHEPLQPSPEFHPMPPRWESARQWKLSVLTIEHRKSTKRKPSQIVSRWTTFTRWISSENEEPIKNFPPGRKWDVAVCWFCILGIPRDSCVFPDKLGVLILQITSSCWCFFLMFLAQRQANFKKKQFSSGGSSF